MTHYRRTTGFEPHRKKFSFLKGTLIVFSAEMLVFLMILTMMTRGHHH